MINSHVGRYWITLPGDKNISTRRLRCWYPTLRSLGVASGAASMLISLVVFCFRGTWCTDGDECAMKMAWRTHCLCLDSSWKARSNVPRDIVSLKRAQRPVQTTVNWFCYYRYAIVMGQQMNLHWTCIRWRRNAMFGTWFVFHDAANMILIHRASSRAATLARRSPLERWKGLLTNGSRYR